MKIPRAGKELETFFMSVVPSDPSIKTRPMFGNIAAFVNGNLFSGLYGHSLFVRLSEADRMELLKVKGAKFFEPMKGRPMKEYVCVPEEWVGESKTTGRWISKSLEWAKNLPAKESKSSKESGKIVRSKVGTRRARH